MLKMMLIIYLEWLPKGSLYPGWRGPTQRINYEQLRSVQEKISKEEE